MFITTKEILSARIPRQEIENTIGSIDVLNSMLYKFVAMMKAGYPGVHDDVRQRLHMLIDAQEDAALPILLESHMDYHNSLKREYEQALKTMEKFDG